MHVEDYLEYWAPAVDNLFPGSWVYPANTSVDKSKRLATALGIEYPLGNHRLDDGLRELLIKLKGPHGKTILKMYRIQKGLKGEIDW
jgi:hypothetical protein